MRSATTLLWVLLAALRLNAGQAAPLLETDFAKGPTGWTLNGEAKLAKLEGGSRPQVLRLTSSGEHQIGTAWTELKQKVPSFSFIADVRVKYEGGSFNDCPGDGFALAFAPVKPQAVGGDGGSLGLFSTPDAIPQFTALEINTWHGQGLGTPEEKQNCSAGKDQTFAFDVIHQDVTNARDEMTEEGTAERGGTKIGQVLPPDGMKIVNGGFYRYQWNIAEDGTMTAYVTGLDEGNKKFQKVKVLQVKMTRKPVDFEGRFGLTAATGSAVETVEVGAARIESPMVEPQ